jgi:CubicO group peptidase (beta-lactamase class C family)
MRSNWRWLPRLDDVPLVKDPETGFGYDNLTSHLLTVIEARAATASTSPGDTADSSSFFCTISA